MVAREARDDAASRTCTALKPFTTAYAMAARAADGEPVCGVAASVFGIVSGSDKISYVALCPAVVPRSHDVC